MNDDYSIKLIEVRIMERYMKIYCNVCINNKYLD